MEIYALQEHMTVNSTMLNCVLGELVKQHSFFLNAQNEQATYIKCEIFNRCLTECLQ